MAYSLCKLYQPKPLGAIKTHEYAQNAIPSTIIHSSGWLVHILGYLLEKAFTKAFTLARFG